MRTLRFACLRLDLQGLTRRNATVGYLFCSASVPGVEQRAEIERIGRNEIPPQAGSTRVAMSLPAAFPEYMNAGRTHPTPFGSSIQNNQR
jgi:hypothetical protein